MKLCAITLLPLLTACASVAPDESFTSDKISVIKAVLETVLTDGHLLPNSSSYAVAICLPEDADPPPKAIPNFHRQKIALCSNLVSNRSGLPRVKGVFAPTFKCSITQISAHHEEFEVRANCRTDGLSASGATYFVHKVDNAWRVHDRRHDWDS